MMGLCTITGLLVNAVALPMIATCVPGSMPRPHPLHIGNKRNLVE
jgi:hypothetical protein